MDGDDANDVVLDGTGPIVTKPPSEFNGSTGKVSLVNVLIFDMCEARFKC